MSKVSQNSERLMYSRGLFHITAYGKIVSGEVVFKYGEDFSTLEKLSLSGQEWEVRLFENGKEGIIVT